MKLEGILTLFLCLLLISVNIEASVGPLDEKPRTEFNVDKSSLSLLILTNTNSTVEKYSKYLNILENNGHILNVVKISKKTDSITLTKYKEFIYDNILIFDSFSNNVEDFYHINIVQQLTSFIDAGRNVIVFTEGANIANTKNFENFATVASVNNKAMRKFANECGIGFQVPGAVALDYFSNKENYLDIIGSISSPRAVIGNEKLSVIYNGGVLVLSKDNSLTFPILTGKETAVSVKLNSLNNYVAIGEQNILVAAMQARNDARATFIADIDLCSNKRFKLSPDNLSFCSDMSLWGFQQRGLLRVSNIKHHTFGNTHSSYQYHVNDEIVYKADFHLWEENKWMPYKGDDIQLEYKMLDPYLRVFLRPAHYFDSNASPNNATQLVKIRAPDKWGIFKFSLKYNKVGLNNIFIEKLAPVRNTKHDGYPRFLLGAYPYYTGAITSLIGLFFFSLFFLFFKPDA